MKDEHFIHLPRKQRLAIIAELLKERQGRRKATPQRRIANVQVLAQAGVKVPRYSSN